ncbi:copper transporter [Modestobacter roseus]|uniref:Copper transport outer membrane protein MctB n=1 Tax=Modestobacter roseus TaxID=1181884 RepID=A0A562IPX5_9ACTN|nr:copper transporter [Modestobacter roseus]MQA35072.1 copper transporter [Modestobacter roseus]TWH72644.1 copper transport outer membrane protein MctB [Modestobacter roseus]
MIDFRYHLVSLIAVFLAVALGIVIGTTQLNGPVLTNLQNQVSQLQEDKRALEDQTQGLQAQLDDDGGFDEAVGPVLVADRLAGSSVLLVIAGGDVDPEVVEGVTALLGSAGATVTGTVRLTDTYADPATTSGLESYVTGPGLPAGVVPAETGDAGELLASVLAQVLMVPGEGDDGAGVPPDTTATAQVLAGLEELGVLSRDTSSVSPAEYAVVLTSGAVEGEDADVRTTALVELATALDAAGAGAVVAGDPVAAEDGGLIAAIRADAGASDNVSTVDNVTAAAGRIATVLALVAEGAGTSGQYGAGEDAQPVPAPVS